jgi:organic radical activating enzyme
VAEIFGPTIQGEGPTAGRPATFLRLSGCNLACVWCDTPYTWDWSRFDRGAEATEMSAPDAVAALQLAGLPDTRRLVVTGGEPLMQQRELIPVLEALRPRVEVETAGTIVPLLELRPFVSSWNVSPKLHHSGNILAKRRKVPALRELRNLGAAFKFVVQTPKDFEEVDLICGEVAIPPSKVWIMPEGVTPAEIREHGRAVVDEVIRRGYNLSGRMQVDLWGAERGH